MTVFLIGMVFGGLIFGNMSVAVERFRRARADFRATRSGLRTLIDMMVNRMWQAVQMVGVAALIAAAAVVVWYQRLK